MTKVCFVNAFEYNYLGTRQLASYLRKFGHETHNILLGHISDGYSPVQELKDEHHGYMILIDGSLISHAGNRWPLSESDFTLLGEVLAEEQPDIIGFSARSTNNYLIPELVPVFRKAAPHALLAAGGYGPTLEPDLYLDGGFDVVIRGDGEEAVLELADAVQAGEKEAALLIKNTYWNKSFGGGRNPMRDQEKHLEKYPPQLIGNDAFSVIADGMVKRHYDPALQSLDYVTYLGRGCTGKCTYCSGGQWRTLYREEGKKAYPRRNRDIHSVIEECSSISDCKRVIGFCDEFWSMSISQTREFFTLYKKNVKKPFFAYLQYDQMVNNRDLFELILDAGLMATGIGFQHGSAAFLKKYYGRNAHYDLLLEYARMLSDNLVRYYCQFIGGNCYETLDDFHECLSLIRKLPSDIEFRELAVLDIFRLRPHPKTPITLIAPRVLTNPMSANEWLYRAVLMQLANKMPEDELQELMTVSSFKRDTMIFYDFSRSWWYRQQRHHYERLIAEEADKDWIFYGAGENYQRNKKFFAPLKPRVILVDRAYLLNKKEVDGIPIVCAEDFLTGSEVDKESRYLIFINPASHVAQNLLRTYKVPRDHIHACEIGLPC